MAPVPVQPHDNCKLHVSPIFSSPFSVTLDSRRDCDARSCDGFATKMAHPKAAAEKKVQSASQQILCFEGVNLKEFSGMHFLGRAGAKRKKFD